MPRKCADAEMAEDRKVALVRVLKVMDRLSSSLVWSLGFAIGNIKLIAEQGGSIEARLQRSVECANDAMMQVNALLFLCTSVRDFVEVGTDEGVDGPFEVSRGPCGTRGGFE